MRSKSLGYYYYHHWCFSNEKLTKKKGMKYTEKNNEKNITISH